MSAVDDVRRVLRREDPGRVVYAPNYWQWFSCQEFAFGGRPLERSLGPIGEWETV